jgi:hypothetical protein
MQCPIWAGKSRNLGKYKFQVLWFRVFMVTSLLATGAGLQHLGQNWINAQESKHRKNSYTPPTVTALLLPLTAQEQEDATSQAKRKTAEDAILQTLNNKRVSLNFGTTPFSDSISFLRDITKLNFVLTAEARDIVDSQSLEISLRLKEISLKNALQLILACSPDLSYEVQGNVVVITSRDESRPATETRFYNIADIINAKTGARLNGEKIIELLEGLLLAEDENEDLMVTVENTVLCAKLSSANHSKISKFFALIRKHHKSMEEEGRGKHDPFWTINPTRITTEPQWVTKYKETLSTRSINLSFKEASLTSVIDFIQEVSGLNITISPDVDAEELRINLKLKTSPLNEALNLILQQSDLVMTFQNETIKLLHQENAHGQYAFDIIGVQDIVYPEEDEDCGCLILSSEGLSKEEQEAEEREEELREKFFEADSLIEIIQNEIGEDYWDDPTSIEVHQGQILIMQTTEITQKVRRIIEKIRKARNQ